MLPLVDGPLRYNQAELQRGLSQARKNTAGWDKDTGVRHFRKQWTRAFARDDGVAGIVIAIVVSILAFSALAVFLSKFAGPTREIPRVQQNAIRQALVRNAVLAYFQRQSVVEFPCPDTDADSNRDGAADACSGASVTTGTLPWATLGISPDDAIDAYGRYFTYAVVSDQTARRACDSVSLAAVYGGGTQYPGSAVTQTALSIHETDQTAADGIYVPFAVISHGPNGLGGVNAGGSDTASPVAGSSEETNAAADTTEVIQGPYEGVPGDDYFDDTVANATSAQIQKICESLSPGGQKNAWLSDDFNDGTIDSAKWDTTVAPGSLPIEANGYTEFTSATTYLSAQASYGFIPAVRPIYVSGYWTPSAGTNTFSIATRATVADLDASADTFTGNGITFRFGSTVTILEDTDATPQSAAFTVTASRRYFIEAYDNGDDVWARITDVLTPASTVTVRDTNITGDTGGDQRVIFLNGPGTNRLDDALIGHPMLSLDSRSGVYAQANADSVDGTTTGDITLEAWIRPRSVAGGSIISQWDGSAASSFRLSLNASGALILDIQDAGGLKDYDLGISPAVNEWTHVAVSYAAGATATDPLVIRSYKNGVSAKRISEVDTDNGIVLPTLTTSVGVDSDFLGNTFTGNIADVRIWESARTASQIAACYQRRLGSSATCATVAGMTNWTLDPGVVGGGFAATAVAAVSGTAGFVPANAWSPALSVYFRALSSDFCAGFEAALYRCDYRDNTTANSLDVTVPSAETGIYAKAWGAGADFTALGSINGGGGAYAGGLIPNSDVLQLTVGNGGGGVAGIGTNTLVERGTDTMVTANGGGIGSGGTTGGLMGTLLGLLQSLTAPGTVPTPGNSTDAYYQPPGGSLTDPGLGGTSGATSGHDGAIVLLW